MAGINDKILMIAAVAVTAVLCVGGMYLIMGGDDQREGLNVSLGPDISGSYTNMAELFSEFEDNTNVRIVSSDVPDPQLSMLLDGSTDMILISSVPPGGIPSEIQDRSIPTSDGMIYVFYVKDNVTAHNLYNWLSVQDL